MNFSFWEKQSLTSPADVTILGSGIVGISTAISVKSARPDLRVKVIDKACVSFGASTKNAGFACFGSVSELLDDIKAMGEEDCAKIVEMRWKGLQLLRSRIPDEVMEYQSCGGLEVFNSDTPAFAYSCFEHIDYCNKFIEQTLGLKNCYSKIANTDFRYFHPEMIFNQYEGSLNPVRMIQALTELARKIGVEFVHGLDVSCIQSADKKLICRGDVEIPYKVLCVCTNGFTRQLFEEIEVVPARNQVLITRPIPDLKLNGCFHYDRGYFYFRNYEGRILLGGARNVDFQNEFTMEPGTTPVIQSALEHFLDKIYPGASSMIEHRWSGTLGVGFSKNPICRWQDEYILVGVRLGGMGVAIGSWLGEKLSGYILERI